MESLYSKMLKAGSITYFMDVKEAKNSKKYLTLTASQLAKEGEKKFKKQSMIVFSSTADEFISTLKEANAAVNGEKEFSKRIKSGKMTYFVDVKQAKNNTKYLSITESEPSKDDPKKYSKKYITVFNNATNDFVDALEEVVGHLK